MKIKLISFLFLIGISFELCSQNNDFEHAVGHIAFTSIVCGIGSIISNPEDNWKISFKKGFLKGALGGYLIFEGKRFVRKYGQTGKLGYIGFSNLSVSLGNSIIDNGINNRRLYERLNFSFGFCRTEIQFYPEFNLSPRIMPFAMIISVYTAAISKDLNLKKTLEYGDIVFSYNDNSKIFNTTGYGALTLLNNITIHQHLLDSKHEKTFMAHEKIHLIQFNNSSYFSSIINKSFSFGKRNGFIKYFILIFIAYILCLYWGLKKLEVVIITVKIYSKLKQNIMKISTLDIDNSKINQN